MPSKPDDSLKLSVDIASGKSSLTLPNPPLQAMRLAATGTVGMRLEEFWRLDLGLAYVSSDARLTAADLEAAWRYYEQNREEIEQAIRENEEV